MNKAKDVALTGQALQTLYIHSKRRTTMIMTIKPVTHAIRLLFLLSQTSEMRSDNRFDILVTSGFIVTIGVGVTDEWRDWYWRDCSHLSKDFSHA